MSLDFSNARIKEHMMKGRFGLKKESLRVTEKGYLSHTKHPFGDDPRMERDFCENQTELITEVADSAYGARQSLAKLQKKAVTTLLSLDSGKELMWPFSNPPYVLGENDIPIAAFHGNLKGKELYREYLAVKYGKHKMLYSGIHFNFSFGDDLLKAAFAFSGFSDFQEYADSVYLELAKKATAYSWLIVYLTAASPVMDGSFLDEKDLGRDVLTKYSSPRCGKNGYWNDFIPFLDYGTRQEYADSIAFYVKSGQLKEVSELYYPVRLKPKGENSLEQLKKNGIDHIELRMLDLNPLDPVGICEEDLEFLHLFLLYLMSLKDGDFPAFEQSVAIKNEQNAAGYDEKNVWIETGWDTSLPLREAALAVLTGMEHFSVHFTDKKWTDVIDFQKQKILCPEKRYAVRVRSLFSENYVEKGLLLAEKYAKEWAAAI